MGFKGAGAPPHVILHGPKGETIDTGIGNAPVQTPGVAALKNPTTGITEVVIAKPSGGRWTVEVAPDSARLVEALQANGTRPATITGKVLGSGQDRRLQYTVKGLAKGQHVDFAEVGTAAGSIIGRVAKDGTGVLAFHPGEGKAGRRDVQAIVTNVDGYVADRRKLGTYTAPNAPRPAAARKLTLKRKGTSIVLSWPRSARGQDDAGRHQVLQRAQPVEDRQAADRAPEGAPGRHDAEDHDHGHLAHRRPGQAGALHAQAPEGQDQAEDQATEGRPPPLSAGPPRRLPGLAGGYPAAQWRRPWRTGSAHATRSGSSAGRPSWPCSTRSSSRIRRPASCTSTAPAGSARARCCARSSASAPQRGWSPRRIDGRELPPIPGALEEILAAAQAEERPLLLFDTYERISGLDGALRTRLLPALPARAIVVVAGRERPAAEWFQDGWEHVTRALALAPFSAAEGRAFVDAHARVDEATAAALVRWSDGSPLALGLASAIAQREGRWDARTARRQPRAGRGARRTARPRPGLRRRRAGAAP